MKFKLSAYENVEVPSQISGMFKGGLIGGLIGLFGACIFSAMVSSMIITTSDPAEPSIAPIVIFLLVWFGFIALGVGYSTYKRQKKLQEAYQHEQWQKGYWNELDNILQKVHETNGDYIAQQDFSRWHGLYRPKANEPVLWMGACGMTQQRERVDAVTRVGAVKFAKLPFKSIGYANVEKVIEHKVKYDHLEGEGVLVITPQRVTFVSQGHGQNWSMPWEDLMSWQPAINAVLVQPSQGQPKAFVFREAGFVPMQDTQIINAMMEIAHDA